MNRCNIRIENLINYIDGIATPDESQRIDVHLANGCPLCQERLVTIRQSVEALRGALDSADSVPSEHSRAFARNLSRLRHPNSTEANPGQSIPLVPHFIAQLVDQQVLATAGTRSVGASSSVQRLYETPNHVITLWEERLTGEPDYYVIGQVYSWGASICMIPDGVLFVASSTGATKWATQEESEFHVPHLAADKYMVQCWLDNAVLAIHNVAIGAA